MRIGVTALLASSALVAAGDASAQSIAADASKATSVAGPATAAPTPPRDRPAIAPVPAWVKPVALPPLASSMAKSDEMPVRVLLLDQQVSLEPGRQTVYSDIALGIQTPQGLAAGNISLPWRPGTDTLTVHKLLIRRGAQVIDVLASGQSFTVVRREQNLESAMLDGVLTANIQPEALQVGDVLEFAASVTSIDPVLKGHVELLSGGWDGAIDQLHYRAQWPSGMAVRWRQNGALPPLRPVKAGGLTTLELAMDKVTPTMAPKGAPLRYQLGRMVELTDFAAWSDAAALMAPLYVKAATIPAQGPLRVEVDRIRAASADPIARTQAALALVQDRVRYVALVMGAGGYVPADAETTWARRYGDCKAKTALLLALLRDLGVQAEPVAVNATAGDGLDGRLPMLGLFNHVLVRATVSGRTYWLDGTRMGDTGLDRLTVPAMGWGLPLVPGAGTGALVRMVPGPLDAPARDTSIRIDASAGISVPAPVTVETVLRGDDAIGVNLSLSNLMGDARDTALRQYWKNQYDFITVKTATAAFDPVRGEERLRMEGSAAMDWSSGWYETDGTRLGYKADFDRDAKQDQGAPYAVAYPYYTRLTETITLPTGFPITQADMPADVVETLAGIEYRRHAEFKDRVFTIRADERSVAPEVSAKDARAAQPALRALYDKVVYLRRPANYQLADGELTASMATTPKDAEGFVDRGVALMDRYRFDEAIADFDRALVLEPKNVWALGDRGMSRIQKGELDTGAKDLDAAQAIDPRNPVVFRGRGMLAERRGKWDEAIAAYSTALEIEPKNGFAFGRRAVANHSAGHEDAAMADAAAALTLSPTWTDMRLMRGSILRNQNKREDALKEAAAIQAASPKDSYAQVAAANMYRALGDLEGAARAYDAALAIKPEPWIYLNRFDGRAPTDRAGRMADIDAALKLDPGFGPMLAARGDELAKAGDLKGAIASLNAAVAKAPKDLFLLNARGMALSRSGDTAGAEKDFAAVRVGMTEPGALNNICWIKATAGIALEAALIDCNAALAKAPDMPGFLDSRALVLLRLGRIDAAIADYDRVLAKDPTIASSLYGRGIAWSRKGEVAKADADIAAAQKRSPDIGKQFDGYGVTRQAGAVTGSGVMR